MGVRRIFSGVGKVDILLIFFRLLAMQGKWTYTKRKCPVLRQQLQTVFSCKKTLHWANVCFSEHGYLKIELTEFKMNYKLSIFRISAKSYENTNKVPFNSNSFSLFSCFSNVLECRKLCEMRFCANGLVVLHSCAPSEGALVAKNSLYSQQCYFFTHASLHIL